MGRKKGKQRGHFSSKVQRAEADAKHHAASSWVDPRYTSGSRPTTTSSGGLQKSQLQQLREERGTVSLTQLRGLLRERERDDTLEYQEMRRRHRMTRGISGSSGTGKDEGSKAAKSVVNQTARHEPGWLLHYDDRRLQDNFEDDTSTSQRRRGRHQQKVPSLQSMSIKALGPALGAYIDAYGVDTMRSILDTLPPQVLTELSISVSSKEGCGVDDDLVSVLGLHNHVESLALYAEANGRVTAKGILSIVPRIVSQRQQSDVNGIDVDRDNGEIVESWEDDLSASVVFEGCTRLTRLELCNLQVDAKDDDDYERIVGEEKELIDAVAKLLRFCPRITHLSLAGSFNSYQYGYHLLRAIPSLLPRLRVLDVSHCTWVDGTLLHQFLVGVANMATIGNCAVELRMINVAGCPNITEKRAQLEQRRVFPAFSTVIATNVERITN